MESIIKDFKCKKGKLISIKFLDHFERDVPVGTPFSETDEYTVTIHGKYIGSNENYHFIEWLEQGSCVNVEPNKRIFGVLKNSIINFDINNTE